jgi:hypothetical protein
MKTQEHNRKLVDAFIACFPKLDEMMAHESLNPVAWQLSKGDADQYGFRRWRPLSCTTDRKALEPLYAELPARFPPTYEQLVLSYRWADVDLGLFKLVANPLGPDLSGLLTHLAGAPDLWEMLIPAGFIQFGKGPDMDFDPVCLDIRSRSRSGDYRIVKIDHEGILCNYRVKIVDQLAPSFEQLIIDTIKRADLIKAV